MILLLAALGCTPEPTYADADMLAAAPVLAVGGDVQLGRRTNALVALKSPANAFSRLPGLLNADLSYVNLECVAAEGGKFGRDKGESAPYYYRARPETLAVLSEAGIDVVGTANNHSGDYGPGAVTEQSALLDGMGIAHPGTGENHEEACAPVFRRAGDLVVAFFTVDATELSYEAGNGPGQCTLDLEDTSAWADHFEARIPPARSQADLVFVGVHWGNNNVTEPTREMKSAAKAMIRAGADGILGSSAHRLHGVGVIDGRPVIYDGGNFLFDSHFKNEGLSSALFRLWLGPHGVLQVRALPVRVDYGFTLPEKPEVATESLARFVARSNDLGTTLRIEDGEAVLDLPLPPARPAPTSAPPPDPKKGFAPLPATAPPAGCVVDAVPPDARGTPKQIGPLTLLGARVQPRKISRRQAVTVETWWTATEPVSTNYWIFQRGQSHDGDGAKMWWGDHEPCDWGWPVTRWTPGTIVHDVANLRPPPRISDGGINILTSLINRREVLVKPMNLAPVLIEKKKKKRK